MEWGTTISFQSLSFVSQPSHKLRLLIPMEKFHCPSCNLYIVSSHFHPTDGFLCKKFMETEVRFPVLFLSPERLISLIYNLLDTKQYLRRMQQTLPTNIMQALKCKRVSCGKCDTYLIQRQQSVYPVSLFHS